MAHLWADRVDTQDATLQNTTNSETFTQLTNLFFDISSNLTRHQLTDDTIDNLWDLRVNAIEGDMILTVPEITKWVGYTLHSNGKPPIKVWVLTYTPVAGSADTLTFNGQVSTFRPSDSGSNVLTYHFRIEGTDVTITE